MFQQIIALIVIIFFISRLFWQKSKKKISQSEFNFWVFFWVVGALSIVNIKKIDVIVANLGFSATGIDVLLYLAVILLYYLVLRLRLREERMEKNITKLTREISLKEYENKNSSSSM